MPSDYGEARQGRFQAVTASTNPPPKQTDPLPCPRCESINTKFCYYNNYNLSQPRYFCKSCRRYWTHGGTLRNVPIGGGTRKNLTTKRARSSLPTSSSSSTATSHEPDRVHLPVPVPVSVFSSGSGGVTQMKETGVEGGNESFGSLLDGSGSGFLALGGYGYGYGVGSGFEEMGLGYGNSRGFWSGQTDAGGYFSGGGGGAIESGGGCNTWQVNDVESGGGNVGGGDYFVWPGLEISMPGKSLK